MDWNACTPVYEGHGNIVVLVPYADMPSEEPLDMSGVTEVRVCVGSTPAASSEDHPGVIDWFLQDAEDTDGLWEIRMRLGLLPDLNHGEQRVRVIVYDEDYPTGLVVTDSLKVNVIGGC